MKPSQRYATKVSPPKEAPSQQQDIARLGGAKTPFVINNDWYKIIVKNALEGFCLLDINGSILDVNNAFCRMEGYSRDELLNMRIQDIDIGFIEASKKNYTQEILEVKRTGGKSGEVQHRCKDGRIIDVLVSTMFLDISLGFLFCFHNDITEQKRICQELKESEERYRALIELGGRLGEAVVMVQDTDKGEGIQTFVSKEWSHITGYSQEELLGMPFFDLLHPKYRKASLERHRRKMNGASILNHFEMSVIRKDGVEVPIELTSAYSMYQGKRANVAYIRDITEHKQVEERYKTIIQTTLDGFFLSDLQGNIMDVNDAFCRMLGYSRDELLNMRIQDIDIGFIEASKNYTQGILEVKRTGGNSGEVQHRCKDGRIIDVLVNIMYLDISPGFLFCFHRDITKHKQADEALRQSKAFSESMIASIKDGFSILDNRGVHLGVNHALCQMTGFAREELIGVGTPHPYWPEEEYEKINQTFQKTLKGDFDDFELVFKRKNGERFPVIVSPSWLKDKEGNVISYFATIKDITNMKSMQEQVIKAEARSVAARESDKMKTELLSLVSHELRTPLASIKGFANTLLQHDVKWSQDEMMDFIHEVDTEADRLSRLVDDLLDMSAIEAGMLSLNKAGCSISIILKEAQPMITEIAQRHELKIKIASRLPLVTVDKERIIQVLSNLVDNAAKFSPMGSQINIEAKKSQGEIIVSVADQGIGISKEEQGRLFDRFYQTKKITSGVKRGTGLGLAISNGLVEAHGGRIWLDSQEGKGSTFYFSLPIYRAD